MISLKKITVPLDFSEASDKAVRYGVELARKFGSELHLLHAYDTTPIMYGEGGYVPPDTSSQIMEAVTKQIREVEIDDAIPVQRKVVEGYPFVQIVRYCKDNDIDLVVMGTHGRGAIAHMLLGSVAEQVVRKAPCPVLVVREGEHDFVLP